MNDYCFYEDYGLYIYIYTKFVINELRNKSFLG